MLQARLLPLVAGLVVLPPPLAARTEEPPAAAEPAPATAPLLHGELALSLAEAIAMGVENNLSVEIARHDPVIAEQRADGAWGSYDPELFGEWGHFDNEAPSAFAIQGLGVITDSGNEGRGGLRGLVPKLGSSYELAYGGSKLKTDRSFQALLPEYRSSLELSLRQPLLKDFLWSAPWFEVKSNRILANEALEEFRRVLMDTVRNNGQQGGIETAYWALVAAKDQLRVAEKSVDTARALRGQTQAQYEVGVVSRVDVVEAEAGVAQREFDRISAENSYRRAQDRLIDLVLGPNLRASSRLEIQPTDAPEPIGYDLDPERAAALAFELRPELSIARREVARRELQTRFARNQKLPRLDLRGSYGQAGLTGVGQEVTTFTDMGPVTVTPDVDGDYFDADDDFFAGAPRQWTAGAVLSFPLGNRQARSEARIAEIELRRARTRLTRVEQDIVLEVREAIRNLGSASEGIEAAEQRRRATEEQLRAERIRLEHGESTPFSVLEREEDLVEAESQKIFALQVYRNSLAELDRAQGTILRNRNIVVEDARPLR